MSKGEGKGTFQMLMHFKSAFSEFSSVSLAQTDIYLEILLWKLLTVRFDVF